MRLILALTLSLGLLLPMAPADNGLNAAGALTDFTKRARVGQSGDSTFAIDARISHPDTPFTFAKVDKIRRLDSVAITLMLQDGNTARPADFVKNNLFLALDGIDTGLALNGFPGNNAVKTQTIRGVPANRPAILAALKTDGALAATVIDQTDDGNFIEVPASFDTTLVLKGKRR